MKTRLPSPRTEKPPHARRGLYDPRFEHDACGIGLICGIKGRQSHAIIRAGLKI